MPHTSLKLQLPPAFNPRFGRRWRRRQSGDAKRRWLWHKGPIITIGGTTNGDVDMRDVTAYDPATGVWTPLTPLPADRYTGLGMIVDDVIYYTTGGATTTYRGVFV